MLHATHDEQVFHGTQLELTINIKEGASCPALIMLLSSRQYISDKLRVEEASTSLLYSLSFSHTCTPQRITHAIFPSVCLSDSRISLMEYDLREPYEEGHPELRPRRIINDTCL